MADPNNEREEIDRLEAKAEALNKLVWPARGRVLKAKNADEAKDAIFEALFFEFHFDQIQGNSLRLKGLLADAGMHGGWAAERQRDLAGIAEGDWVMAKDATEAVLGYVIESREVLEGMQLDPNFSFREKLIFTDDSSEAMLVAGEYVQEQVNLVPDKTESYVHPNLADLEAQIASL